MTIPLRMIIGLKLGSWNDKHVRFEWGKKPPARWSALNDLSIWMLRKS